MNKKNIEENLIYIVSEFLHELDSQRALQSISLDASLENNLGIDSLGRVELLHRIEKQFNIKLPESAMAQAHTLRDLVKLISTASQHMTKGIHYQNKIAIIEAITLDVSGFSTLTDIIAYYGIKAATRSHAYLHNENGEEQVITYGQMFTQSQAFARGLLHLGIKPGETVAIMLPTSADFLYAFCGTLLAGAIPVPIYPPLRPDRIEEYALREAKILNNAQARLLVTFSQAKTLSQILRNFVPSLIQVSTVASLQINNGKLADTSIEEDDIALIQYTSGSTGDPKGVPLTHKNFLANIRALGVGIPILPNDAVVTWLPLYHDMGLMNWLGSLYFGIPVTILSPLTFLTRPESWLWSIHYHRATLSGGPNFAYELCIRKINEEDIAGLDLSSWRFAFNGAEAINPKTLENFYKKFNRYGFGEKTFAPVYGLAENTVGLTLALPNRSPRIDKIQREWFASANKAIPASPIEKNTHAFVSCGTALPGHQIRVVDDADLNVPERVIGNIQFKGPSAMSGYYNNPTATQQVYHNGWWSTGDLGYLADDELFITGRKKDLIIKAGRNLAPDEIEEIVGQITEIRKGCVVAFGASDPLLGTEKLIVVAETYVVNKAKLQSLRKTIIEKMADALGEPPDTIILVPPHTVPKTSSGKLQRSLCKKLYLDGKLSYRPLSAKFQMVKLFCHSILQKTVRIILTLARVIYTAYLGLILLLTLPFIITSLLIFKQKTSGSIVKFWARNIFRLAGCPVTLKGSEHLLDQAPVIFVANHSSYVDSLLLLGILPRGVIFTAKKELLHSPIIKLFIKKLNYLTIERLDFAQSIDSKNEIEKVLQQKQSILIFPEGTFTYATGLRSFKLGAFIMAVETNTPICTISIQGTRTILRGDEKLFRPGRINMTIEKLIYPQNKQWDEVLRLHTIVRTAMATHCKEGAVDLIIAGP